MSRILKLQQVLARHLRIAELKGRSVIPCKTYKEAKRLRAMFHTFIGYLERVERKSPEQRKLDADSGMLELLPIKDNLYFSIKKMRGDRGVLTVEYKDTLWLRKTLEEAARAQESALIPDSELIKNRLQEDTAFWLDDD